MTFPPTWVEDPKEGEEKGAYKQGNASLKHGYLVYFYILHACNMKTYLRPIDPFPANAKYLGGLTAAHFLVYFGIFYP